MFSDYDVIIAIKDLSTNVKKGTVGAILMCFKNDDYEIEFIDENGDFLELLTVPGSDIVLKE